MEQVNHSKILKCSFCKCQHHNISICQLAIEAGYILHNSVMNIINITINTNPNNLFTTIKSYLKLHNLKELKLLIRLHKDVYIFAEDILTNPLFNINGENIFNINRHNLNLKYGIVKILTVYYLFNKIILPKKFNINVQVINNLDLSSFHCPICLDDKEQSDCVLLNCNHKVCNNCFELYLEKLDINISPCCSLCRENITSIFVTNEENKNKMNNYSE